MKKLFLVLGIAVLLMVTTVYAEGNPIEAFYLQIIQKLDGIKTAIENQQTQVIVNAPQGEPGLDCWDLNGNYECNLETEDKNEDGECNALDCQGPKGDKGDTGGVGGLDCVTTRKTEQDAKSLLVDCLSKDYTVTGGGCRGATNLMVSQPQYFTYNSGWWCEMETSGFLDGFAICCRLA